MGAADLDDQVGLQVEDDLLVDPQVEYFSDRDAVIFHPDRLRRAPPRIPAARRRCDLFVVDQSRRSASSVLLHEPAIKVWFRVVDALGSPGSVPVLKLVGATPVHSNT